MRKRLLSILLVLFMVFTMMPVSALAEEVDNAIITTYEVSGTDDVPAFANGDIINLTGQWTPSGGTITIPNNVTSLTINFNRKQLTGNITVEGGGGGMNLTLENANLGGTITFGDRPDNKLNFVGENNVINNFNGAGCIVAGSTKLTIECTNYLTFNSVPNSPAINAPNGYVTISSGNITATRSPGEDYTITAKVLEIKGSASLRVHSWRDLGVRAMEGVVVQGSSSLDTYSVKGDLTVLGGSATVKGNVDGKLDVKSGGSARITGNLSGEKFVEEGGTAIVGNKVPIGKTPLPTLTVQVGDKLILDADAIAYDPDGDAISIIICDVWDGHGYIECEYDWHTGKKVVKGLAEGSGKIRVVVDDAYGGVAFDIEVPITVTAALPAAYTVTYKPGTNGMGSEVSETKTYDEALTLKGSIFTREGFTQTGWATNDGGEKAYDLGGSYSANADIDLYPVWTINSNKITTTLTFEDSTSTQDCTSTSFHSNHIHADGKKCWSWNADNKTLTLDGINLEMSNDSGCGIRLVANNAVITLTDGSDNTIATNGSAWYPIMTWDDLTINGNGKLIALNTTGGNNHAISVDDDLIIDGAEVIATHNGCIEDSTDARGISARNITIQGNSKVTASGDSGISAYQSLTIKSGMVTGMGLEFCGISANTLTLEGGTVTATAASGKKPFNQEPTLSGLIHKYGTGTWNNTEGTTCTYEEGATLTYTVTYKPGTNGMGSEASDTKTHDVSLTLKGSIFTREGFTQTGWATSDGGGKVYDLSGSYSANTAIELYPVWTVNSNKITTTLTFEDSTHTQDCTSTTLHINHIHADGTKCWSWNADSKTLTLNGIDLEMSSGDEYGYGIKLMANNAVIALTDGSVNTIATSGLAGYTISNTTNLKITGSGKLIVKNTTGKNNSALFSNGELVIDGAEVIVTHNSCTEDKSNSCGITAMNMTIQGNSKVTASGDHGIFVYRNLTMKYGTLTGTGLKVSGITAGQTLTIEGGNMTSNGGPKSVSVYGPTIKLLGGTVMSTAAIGQQPFSTEPTLSGLIHKYGTGTWYNISGTTCVYEKGATYTLTYTAGANGTITGNGAQTVSHGGNGSIVTATPNPGYHFVSWSDGVLTASRTEKNVMGSISVTANFAADTYTITLNANGGNALTPATLITGANGKLTSLPVSTRSGSYSFKGWFTEASGGTAVTTDTVFSADATIYAHWTYTGGSGSGTSTTAPTPSSTIKGEVIYSGEAVNGINAQVTNSNDGTKVISFKSQEAIMEKKVDGTTQAFSNFNKVGFTAAVGTTSSINMSGDGTIQIKDLINGTKSTFNMIFHMGESQNIVIGKINVKVDENGEISLSSTLIDPYGVIIDPSTGEPITGVQVTLYYADTARNKMNGKAPNTPVELPLLDGFKPNDNKNPQVSDESGSYAFMVYPTSDYYIIATKEGYETYKSMTISVEQEIVKWDFKMNKPLIGTKRLAGESRVDTGLSIAKANYSTKLKNVVLAAASNYPDALAGSVLAYKLNAPILLVGSTDMEQNKVIDYMKSNLNSAGTVYILGGTGAVGLEIENKISEAGFNNITRISGKNRSETALKITDFLEVPIGRPLILVNEGNYADALSVSTSAAAAQSPILLIGKDGLTAEVKQKIAEIKPIKIYLIGGEGVISTKVASQVAEITDLDQEKIIRIGGKDRYATSLAVAKYFGLSGKNVCLATGRNFPDALAGSVYAANYNAPVILVDDIILQETKEYLISRKISGAAIFGGEGVIGKEIERELLNLLVSK